MLGNDFPTLSPENSDAQRNSSPDQSAAKPFGDYAAAVTAAPVHPVTPPVRIGALPGRRTGSNKASNGNRSAVVGISMENNHLRSIGTARAVELFGSRLDPDSIDDDLIRCVQAFKNNIDVVKIECTKLKSCYMELHSSYHVSVRIGVDDFDRAVNLFMSAAAWPKGVFVKRFLKNNKGSK